MFSLKNYNTFGIEVFAKQLITISSEAELIEQLSQYHNQELFILSGGSNMLLTKNIDKPVFHIHNKGIRLVKENNTHVWIEAQAGENWHEFVLWTLRQNYGGLENLSLIPGNVGSSPIQNIGAYGVEIKDVMDSCRAIHIKDLTKHTFTNAECKFGYRESIFKSEVKGQYIITSVTYKLTKTHHQLHTNYGVIEHELTNQGITHPTIQDISKAVIAIRQSKLPDPKELGNSGSFFKNPIIPLEQYQKIQLEYPDIPSYPAGENLVKVPAGWLIEHSGLKGYRAGNCGVHQKQALVLVNYGGASGQEILDLAHYVQQTVFQKYHIAIEMEVNVF